MSDRDIIFNYSLTISEIASIQRTIYRRRRLGLPALDLPARIHQLMQRLIRFEDLMDRIPDIRARIAVRCRYALGYSIPETAEFMNLSRKTVQKITKNIIDNI